MIKPIHYIKGYFSALIVYPIAELIERRNIRRKRKELRNYYKLDFSKRKDIMNKRLASIVEFAGSNVPYYKDLFKQKGFDHFKIRKDVRYLEDLPYLTKDIVREQGARLLSQDLVGLRYHNMKTGGSTGLSAHFFYDQEAVDYSAAVTLYARERVGKMKYHSELHFACRFPDAVKPIKWSREDWKCLAMNRSNIFFDRLDANGLDEMWKTLEQRQPYLVHAHPSTIHALASHIHRTIKKGKAFTIFESSGELLELHQLEMISTALCCKVINRYGLAELGVMAYQLNGEGHGLQVLDSEGWPESLPAGEAGEHELVFTGFRNKLMPLIRYRTGDMAKVDECSDGFYLSSVMGRIHDLVPINGIPHPTHHIMDMIDHRIGGVQEFQIDLRDAKPILRIVPEHNSNCENIKNKINEYWGDAFHVQFVDNTGFIRVGRHQKFRHLVH